MDEAEPRIRSSATPRPSSAATSTTVIGDLSPELQANAEQIVQTFLSP